MRAWMSLLMESDGELFGGQAGGRVVERAVAGPRRRLAGLGGMRGAGVAATMTRPTVQNREGERAAGKADDAFERALARVTTVGRC